MPMKPPSLFAEHVSTVGAIPFSPAKSAVSALVDRRENLGHQGLMIRVKCNSLS